MTWYREEMVMILKFLGMLHDIKIWPKYSNTLKPQKFNPFFDSFFVNHFYNHGKLFELKDFLYESALTLNGSNGLTE